MRDWKIAEAEYSNDDFTYQRSIPCLIKGTIKNAVPNVIYEILYRDTTRGIYIGGEKILCENIAAYREINND